MSAKIWLLRYPVGLIKLVSPPTNSALIASENPLE